jgi:hypothetical protein
MSATAEIYRKGVAQSAERGGGGAIDLAMHILRLSFVDAVKRLSR